MLKCGLLFCLLISAFFASAQPGKIAGMVMAGNDRISAAQIKNIHNHIQQTSDERGQFEISASTGDTLIISKTDYINDTLAIANQQSLIVQLKRTATLLKQVEVNSTAISPASVYAANKKEYRLIYFWGDDSHIFGVSTDMGYIPGVTINIDKLNNALGKRGRDSRRLQRNFATDYQSSVIDQRFNPIAARVTGYKDKQLSDFIRDNRPSYEMVSKASDYELIQYVKKKLAGKKV
jgi:hypothetical protein